MICVAGAPTLELASMYDSLTFSLKETTPLSPAIEVSLRKALEIRSRILGDKHDDVMRR